jgi:hypothetical protein
MPQSTDEFSAPPLCGGTIAWRLRSRDRNGGWSFSHVSSVFTYAQLKLLTKEIYEWKKKERIDEKVRRCAHPVLKTGSWICSHTYSRDITSDHSPKNGRRRNQLEKVREQQLRQIQRTPMHPRCFRPFEREAYIQAGVAVAANAFRIPIYRLVVGSAGHIVSSPSMPQHDKWRFQHEQDTVSLVARTEEYVTTLLAGSVGHLILQEKSFNYRRPSTGRKHLKDRRLTEARNGEGWLNDRAVYLTFIWLWQTDLANVDSTIVRLWHKAEALLRQPTRRRQVERLAIRLLVRRELFEHEINAFLRR